MVVVDISIVVFVAGIVGSIGAAENPPFLPAVFAGRFCRPFLPAVFAMRFFVGRESDPLSRQARDKTIRTRLNTKERFRAESVNAGKLLVYG